MVYFVLFSIAAVTRYTQILCFSVITEMDLEEEKLADKSEWKKQSLPWINFDFLGILTI